MFKNVYLGDKVWFKIMGYIVCFKLLGCYRRYIKFKVTVALWNNYLF